TCSAIRRASTIE
nr:Chain B, PLN [Homo sapiens]